MADGNSRFQSQSSQGQTTQERLSTHTVGLVALSDYRKRRADVLEQQEREAREAALSASSRGGTTSGAATPDPNASDSGSGNKQPAKKKVKGKKKQGKSLLSFDDEEGDDGELEIVKGKVGDKNKNKDKEEEEETADGDGKKSKFAPNAGVTVVPKAMTKSALRKEAAERETLRKEFLIQREAVKAAEIAIPFVFYDGSNIPGGMVRVKKGDFVWLFLDKSRKVGAERGVGEKSNARRAWARVGVDDLMMIRGTIIIPHHYDFYYFLANKCVGPDGQRIFNYSPEAPTQPQLPSSTSTSEPLSTAESKAAAALALPDVNTLEGAQDDPNYTKVVDRRWYMRNKHIYPASTWYEFDAERDFAGEVRRDAGGNAFFFSR